LTVHAVCPRSNTGTTGCTAAAGASATTRRARLTAGRRSVKEDRVRTDRAHAALVIDDDGAAQGWCQFGSPEERAEAISEVTAGRQPPGRFLFSATVELFEQYGFTRIRRVGKHAWILNRIVGPQ
jgi:hypothetical protein